MQESLGEPAVGMRAHSTTLVAVQPDRIYLVRHGEVHNPDHIVYADLPGYGLSDLGRAQASAAGTYLGGKGVTTIVASPLQRARETAHLMAIALDVPVIADEDLTEWKLGARWAGLRWEELPTQRPGELEAYLNHPDSLEFSPESLTALATRVEAAITRQVAIEGPGLVFVSHQDPVHAARRRMTGEGFLAFNEGKPRHASVVTLEAARGHWKVVAEWEPPQGTPFPPS